MDQGDRKYYCITMLTVFKPWRHGNDLRKDEETWDGGFNRFSFSTLYRVGISQRARQELRKDREPKVNPADEQAGMK